MTEPHEKELEPQLSALTDWRGPAIELWRDALKNSGRPASHSTLRRFLNTPVPKWAMAAAALIVIAASLQLMFVASFRSDSAEYSASYDAEMPAASAPPTNSMTMIDESGSVGNGYGAADVPARSVGGGPAVAGSLSPHQTTPPWESADVVAPDQRQVVRKATVELNAPDVRAAFMKASLLISAARGEFIEESSLTGEADRAQAHLKMRVEAARLSEVLNQLRELGEVVSEKTDGEDITGQIFDLEARLRNEQRIEQELLELLEKREDAPLKEVLELRQHIASIREQIERMTAQRTQMERLVSLATILVLIRATDAPSPEESSLGSYFSEHTQQAWRKGLLVLADTIAFLLRVLVGGVIWWVLLLLIALRLWNQHRRAAMGA